MVLGWMEGLTDCVDVEVVMMCTLVHMHAIAETMERMLLSSGWSIAGRYASLRGYGDMKISNDADGMISCALLQAMRPRF